MLWSEIWGKASKKFSKQAIYDHIEGHGAELSASMGQHSMILTLTCVADDFQLLFPVWQDVALHPVFLKDELKNAKRQVLQRINQRQDSWMQQGSYLFKQDFFGNHPYHKQGQGPDDAVMRRWCGNFIQLAADLKAEGVTVYNATRDTVLEAFEKRELEKC